MAGGPGPPWLDQLVAPREEVYALLAAPQHRRFTRPTRPWTACRWTRRRAPNILFLHYANLSADLDGQMRWLAGQLGITIPERAWPALVRAASFENMSRNADQLIPVPGLFQSNAAFFRRGTSGEGRETLSDAELARYHARAGELAPPEMLAWLHAPRPAAGGHVRQRSGPPGAGW